MSIAALTAATRRRRRTRILVSDTFTRADSATTLGSAETGQVWVPGGNSVWGISSNQAAYVSATTGPYDLIDAGVSDATITVRIPVLGGEPGIFFRTTDPNNYWRAVLSAGKLFLQKAVAGTVTALASPAVTFNAGDTMGVRCAGSAITTLVNGVVVSTASDSQWAAITKHGFGFGATSTLARFDDFKVTAP